MTRHLSTLSVLHYVYGALICVGGLALLFLPVLSSFIEAGMLADEDFNGDPALAAQFLRYIGWALFVFLEVFGILNILSGTWIAARRNRIGSMIIAGFDCLNFPLGLALGIFTLVVLSDAEVKQAYGAPEMRSI